MNCSSGLYLHIHGAAKCQWTKSERRETGYGEYRNVTVPYYGEDVYLDTTTYLFGEAGGALIELPCGIHRYAFSCPLPPHLPESLDGKYGNISYTCEAMLDIPENFNEHFKTHFTVVRHDDLNESPELEIPIKSEEDHTFCCFCCESDPVFMTVTIPRSGYVPGQNIPVTVEYVNKSSYEIEDTQIYLERNIEFKRFCLDYLII